MKQCLLGSLDFYLGPPINPPVVEWTLQLCDALVYIRSLGWAHNQLWPSNIMHCDTSDGVRSLPTDGPQLTRIMDLNVMCARVP